MGGRVTNAPGIVAVLGLAAWLITPSAARGQVQVIERVSVASDGTQADAPSSDASLSADGGVVAVVTAATSLVPGCATAPSDTGNVFLRDRVARTTACVPAGGGDPASPALSGDGRRVVFRKRVGGGATPPVIQTFVHDRLTGETRMASVTSDGTPANTPPAHRDTTLPPAISENGAVVAFGSSGDNLVAGIRGLHVYVHDDATGQTTWVSRLTDGTPVRASAQGGAPALSADGRLVAWTGADGRVYARDRATGITTLVSAATDGRPGRVGASARPWISPDGRFVAFVSADDTLTPGDGNGVVDLFLVDRAAGTLERIGVPGAGPRGTDSVCPDAASLVACEVALSGDGRRLAFASPAALTPDDTNGVMDVFTYDRIGGAVARVSVAADGTQGDGPSARPRLSADGTLVSFLSAATTLVPGDTNGAVDAFVARSGAGAPGSAVFPIRAFRLAP